MGRGNSQRPEESAVAVGDRPLVDPRALVIDARPDRAAVERGGTEKAQCRCGDSAEFTCGLTCRISQTTDNKRACIVVDAVSVFPSRDGEPCVLKHRGGVGQPSQMTVVGPGHQQRSVRRNTHDTRTRDNPFGRSVNGRFRLRSPATTRSTSAAVEMPTAGQSKCCPARLAVRFIA